MSKEKLVPKLRFEEFENSNGWEKVELKDFLTKSVDNRGKTPPTTIEGDHPLIEVASIGKMTPDYSKVSKFMNEEIFKSKLRGYLKENDILFSTVGSIGTVSLMDDNKKAAIAQNIVGFRAKEGHVPEYVYSMLTSNYNQRRSNRIAMGAVQPSIKVSQLVNVKYPLSIIKEEQNKIGTFFKKIDEMIQVQQSKVNKVKNIKSAYLSEMFPKEGEKYPKNRFRGFTEPWESYKLNDMGMSLASLSGKSKKDFGHGDAEFVTYMNVFSNPVAKGNLTNQIKIDQSQTEVEYGDIFFTVSSEIPEEVGMSSVWLYNRPNVYLNSFCFGFRPIKDLNPYYMAYMLRSPVAREKFISLAQGISRYNISKTKTMELSFPIPVYEEQEKIGEFFKNLDNQISIEEEKLAKLEKLKQAYLNDMFV